MKQSKSLLLVLGVLSAAFLAGGTSAVLGTCGPFTDTNNDSFCPFILEIFYLEITTGTTATTYSPTNPVTRLQMAIFLSREADRVLLRGSRRAVLDQFWTPQDERALKLTPAGIGPAQVRSDGQDLWVANQFGNTVTRVRGNDGFELANWTGAAQAYGVLVAAGRIFVTGTTDPGALYRIVPRDPPGAVTTVASNLGANPRGLGYDGSRIWTANSGGGSVSIVTPGASVPWTVTTVTTGFGAPQGVLYDGSNIWVTDANLLKLDSAGGILQTVTIGFGRFPAFDGTNIWVPGPTSSVSVVRAASGAVLTVLTGNGLATPFTAAFDGRRVLVTNNNGNSVSLWKAADLTPLGSISTGANSDPVGACSDGIGFWITLAGNSSLARF